MRLYRTIKYLKPKQFFYFIKRRFLPLASVTYANNTVANNELSLSPPLLYDLSDEPYKFTFLNESEVFEQGRVDWVSSSKNRLWVYNLHYFDYLRSERDIIEKIHLVKHWVDNNPQNETPGWEPFTCSLRIVNWIFFIVQHDVSDKKIIASLYTQALWLEKNDEKHILANHYFENLKALLFASYFFQSKDADRWYDYASKKLAQQIEEQFLADGGHYERTPQYHGLMLENLLDIYNLVSNNMSVRHYEYTGQLVNTLLAAMRFHQGILMPDGSLPMFNDTAQGISPSFNEFHGYAKQLNLTDDMVNVSSLINYPDSGLFGYRNHQDMWVIDAGAIGPSYQPGHTHCDMLSYELFIDSHPFIVDTGVCEYQPGKLRQYVRSTKAHNTLQVGDHEQSEVWGEFRVGERARIIAANIEENSNGVKFEGEINAFRLLSKSIRHKRVGQFIENTVSGQFQSLTIEDTLSSDSSVLQGLLVYNYVHFHPDINVEILSENTVCVSKNEVKLLLIVHTEDVGLTTEKCAYCPEFGVLQDSICLVLSKNATMFGEMKYTITRVE